MPPRSTRMLRKPHSGMPRTSTRTAAASVHCRPECRLRFASDGCEHVPNTCEATPLVLRSGVRKTPSGAASSTDSTGLSAGRCRSSMQHPGFSAAEGPDGVQTMYRTRTSNSGCMYLSLTWDGSVTLAGAMSARCFRLGLSSLARSLGPRRRPPSGAPAGFLGTGVGSVSHVVCSSLASSLITRLEVLANAAKAIGPGGSSLRGGGAK